MLRNMSLRVQTAEQVLLELRQAHLEMRKQQDEVLRGRGGGQVGKLKSEGLTGKPEALLFIHGQAILPDHESTHRRCAEPLVPWRSAAEEPSVPEKPAEEAEAEDGTAEGQVSEEQQKREEEEQRKLIGYNEAAKTFKRFRPDFKCGSRVPLLPDEEVVECDRLSVTPCCSAPAALQTLYPGAAGYSIELAASKLGPGFPGFQAYHTSVKVDDLEYSFSGDGIVIGRGLPSHVRMADKPQVLYMGLTRISGEDLKEQLGRFFKRGTYDLLRKNCNSFTDCALFFLLDSRLDPGYRGLFGVMWFADLPA
ncbi:spin [Symbiodinium necroappetens]|uniref:Spin protein n=1 Tax=Symbiodinium necroappetens TaxID=1628268 RepID=A0A812WYY6_9DINO|nr:spin [Symbiodinium necroappetens]